MIIGDTRPLTGLRAMLFIDGTNFLIELFRTLELDSLKAEKPPPNTNWVGNWVLMTALGALRDTHPVRHFWFASFTGNDTEESEYRTRLRAARFTPVVFKKFQGHPEKRVDIALTTELLVNAHQKNFDIAILVSGDADYLSVVQEAKRYGGQIFGCFFKRNLNPELQLAFDLFFPIEIVDEEQRAHYVKHLTATPQI